MKRTSVALVGNKDDERIVTIVTGPVGVALASARLTLTDQLDPPADHPLLEGLRALPLSTVERTKRGRDLVDAYWQSRHKEDASQ